MLTRMAGFRSRLTSNSLKIKDKINSIELPEKYKGTIVEKWTKYWKQLYIDYNEVIIDFGRQCKEKPKKTLFYSILLGSTYYCCKNNPETSDFYDQLLVYSNEMALVHESCHNKTSSDYIKYINRCSNEGTIKRFTIGVASFLWISDYNKSLNLYKANCPHLKPQYTKLHERVFDVGFLNVWWNLKNKLTDFDINIENNVEMK